MNEWVNIIGGLVITGTTVLVTWLLSRHKPAVDRRTADVAEKQLVLESLKAASLVWKELAESALTRAEAAEVASKAASQLAQECRDGMLEANSRAARAERYNTILLEHWPEGQLLPRDYKGDE